MEEARRMREEDAAAREALNTKLQAAIAVSQHGAGAPVGHRCRICSSLRHFALGQCSSAHP